jgi:hypothetical protein
MRSNGYPGESDSKRAARLFVYRLASGAPRVGHAVALAGVAPEAEVGLMRDYLRWPGERAHFVDWAKDTLARTQVVAALERVKLDWPEADVVQGDVNEVVDTLPIIGFANLDFMGFSRDSVMPCVRRVLRRLAPGGIMALTWFRGRDRDIPERSAWDVFEAARDVDNLEERRWAGVLRLVERWSTERGIQLDLRGAIEYLHTPKGGRNCGAMSVAVWQRRRSDGEGT